MLATGLKILNTDPEYRDKQAPTESLLEPLVADMRVAVAALVPQGYLPPAELNEEEVREECDLAARHAIEAWVGRLIWSQPRVPALPDGTSLLVCEDYEAARVANEIYLQRHAIVDRLFYTESISLAVGGKHHGKTTLVRTAAMCVMRGVEFMGRATQQGPVIYAASDDEVASTRMELLRMGWNAKSDPLTLVHINPEQMGNPEAILKEVSALAVKSGAILIILDMLFDFAGIRDEMGYAHTRQAIGKIQILADQTKAHVLSTHHSPKYMTDSMNAATAALGSQGIAARFSPIILTRKWADDLFSVDSTMTRDPRGLAIPPTCVKRTEQGWAEADGEFRDWMKWKIYAPRIMGMIVGGEPGKEYTVTGVAQEFDIPRPQAQNALYQLWRQGDLAREKRGRGFRYWKMLEPSTEPAPEMDTREAQPSWWRGGSD